jgi:hypothetical protein
MLRVCCTAIVCLVVDFVGYRAGVEAELPTSAPLEGRWQIVSVQRSGEMAPVGGALTFADDTVSYEPGHFYIGWDDPIFQGPPSSLVTSTVQGRPAAIPDGTY